MNIHKLAIWIMQKPFYVTIIYFWKYRFVRGRYITSTNKLNKLMKKINSNRRMIFSLSLSIFLFLSRVFRDNSSIVMLNQIHENFNR